MFGRFFFFLLLLASTTIDTATAIADCTGELPTVCGILPSTFSDLAPSCTSTASPCPYTCVCTLDGGFDRCGVCGGSGVFPAPVRLAPTTSLPYAARLGGSVATWNGSVALSQHIAQNIPVVNPAPVVTWLLNHTTGDYNEYVLPYTTAAFTDATTLTAVPLGTGYGLAMSENYLLVGSHATTPRAVQLWVRNFGNTPPWNLVWSSNDGCPGTYHYFGYATALDERVPQGAFPGNWGLAIAGDPAAHYSGRVYVWMTYSNEILQELYVGFGNVSSAYCFGESVSADSGWLVVGAPRFTNEALVSKCGAVYVYKWNPTVGVQGLYEYYARIDPPTPTTNGGFGESVSVWENFVMIGDKQREVFIYMVSGVSYILMNPVQRPPGVNVDSRLGFSVSIWDQFAIAGDEKFVPVPTAFGTTFVWDRNPTSTNFWRHVYDLYDTSSDVLTYYGASVSNRGGCYAVSGVPLGGTNGLAYVVDLCRDDCYGCDGVLNSCVHADACDVCPGGVLPADNSTCTDCLGIVLGAAQEDACGVCNGLNNTCVVFSVPNMTIDCNSTFSYNLSHAFESSRGLATWTLASPFAHLGVATISGRLLTYKGSPFGYGVDVFGVKGTLSSGVTTTFLVYVNISVCPDCNGDIGGNVLPDVCGVCGGDNSTCLGCDGVPNSGVVDDYCGVCGGSGTTCVFIVPVDTSDVTCTGQLVFQLQHLPANLHVTWSIIDGPLYGTAGISPFGVLQWFNDLHIGYEQIIVRATSIANPSVFGLANISFVINDCSDCSGTQMGTQVYDLCGVCGGNSISCMDCRGIPNGVASLDACGICNGDGSTCRDCAGIQNGGAIIDQCGICGGDGLSCTGAGIPPGGYFAFTVAALIAIGGIIAFAIVSYRHFFVATEIARQGGQNVLRMEEATPEPRPVAQPAFAMVVPSSRPAAFAYVPADGLQLRTSVSRSSVKG